MKKQFVLSYFGGPSKTARAIGIRPPSVHEWPDDIPDSAVGRIVRLRPDAWTAWIDLQQRAQETECSPLQ
ncbi:Cro/CI family transcriptional regulator [Microvirgula aerodenitrificans]|uniref:Cro/CI family transcriptional regulator n=1 Tax=Microvirgula aerodenitrificans TaxID=57480 RepID=UPI0036F37ECD